MARILVVDDASIPRTMISNILKKDGHEPVLACNGCQALEIVTTQRIDCIITDLIMPKMAGLEFMEALAQKESKIPIVVITADIQESTRNRCFEKGAKALMNKPVRANELRKVLTHVLDGKGESA